MAPPQQEANRVATNAGKGEVVDAAVRLAETKGIPEHYQVFGIVTVGKQTLRTQPLKPGEVGGDAQRVVLFLSFFISSVRFSHLLMT
jgi:hypothetical protein